MPDFIILSRLTPEGRRSGAQRYANDATLSAAVEALGGKVREHYALFGEHDFCSIVSLPNNEAAQVLGAGEMGFAGVERSLLPAIDLPLFLRLCEQTTETSGPHRWQVNLGARMLRRAVQPFIRLNRDARRYFDPLVIEGREHLRGLSGPVIFIANHASHLDPAALNRVIPRRYRARTFWGSAADRWFLKGRKELYNQGWWRSLAWGMFPIQRGGGSGALAYPEWLLDRGGSIAIFPEGTRTSTGTMGKFKPGPAILAIKKRIPVVPVYMDGLRHLRPKGSKEMCAGPVKAVVGTPMLFPPDADIAAATRALRQVMQGLQKECRARRDVSARPTRSEEADPGHGPGPADDAKRILAG